MSVDSQLVPTTFIQALLDHGHLDDDATEVANKVLAAEDEDLTEVELTVFQSAILDNPAGRDCRSPRAHEVETWEDQVAVINDPKGWCPGCRNAWAKS
jgi:hypothetical protein